jgi:hypothetical protein
MSNSIIYDTEIEYILDGVPDNVFNDGQEISIDSMDYIFSGVYDSNIDASKGIMIENVLSGISKNDPDNIELLQYDSYLSPKSKQTIIVCPNAPIKIRQHIDAEIVPKKLF